VDKLRLALWVIDGLGLIGVIAFSVLAALKPDNTGYVAGQIVCAVLVLGSVLLLRLSHQPSSHESQERSRHHE
jgi:4-amino-4-deoxy-L-arabinose transferase-like glycosyltransferase